MSRNPLFYPNDFTLSSSLQEKGIDALNSSIIRLTRESNITSIRQVISNTTALLGSIQNQNLGVVLLNGVMPTRLVGRFIAPTPPPNGTHGYLCGGRKVISTNPTTVQIMRQVERFNFGTETMLDLGLNALPYGVDTGYGLGGQSRGYLQAGEGGGDAIRVNFDTNAFTGTSFKLLSSAADRTAYGATTRNRVNGYTMGGARGGGTTMEKFIFRFNYAGEISVQIAATLLNNTAFNSGFASKFNGYNAGGSEDTTNTSNAAISRIQRLAFSTEAVAQVSSALNPPFTWASCWVPGNASAAYLMGMRSRGTFPTGTDPAIMYSPNFTQKFTYSGETISRLGSTTTNGFHSETLLGSGLASYGSMLWTHSSSTYTTQLNGSFVRSSQTLKINYQTEVMSTIAAAMKADYQSHNLMQGAGIDNYAI